MDALGDLPVSLEALEEVVAVFMSDAPHAGPKAPGAMLREIIPQMIHAHGRVKVYHGSNELSAYDTRQSEVDYRAALVENHKEEDSSAQHVEVEDLLKLEQELLRTMFPPKCFVAPELNPDQYPSTPPPEFTASAYVQAARLYGVVAFGALTDTERVRRLLPTSCS